MTIYNNPALGAAFTDVASMFAPPPSGDLANWALAKERNQKTSQLAQLFGAGANPSEQAALTGVQSYGQTPTGFNYQVDQTNATSRANNLQDNQFSTVSNMYGPRGQGFSTPAMPTSISDFLQLPAMPGVAPTDKPMSETEVKGGWLQDVFDRGLVTPQNVATQYNSGTNVEEVIGPDGKPLIMSRDAAVGMQPAAKAPLVSMGSESAYDKELGGARGKMNAEIETEASDAQATLNTVSAMRDLMTDPNFYSGPAADQVQALKALGASLGITVPDAAAPMEAFVALANQFILDAAGGSLGNQISNGDTAIIRNTKPNLNYTPDGNKLLLDMVEKVLLRKMEVVQWAEEYKATHNGRLDGGWVAFQKAKAEANPLFQQESSGPAIGYVEDGFQFNGGDPADASSWTPVGGN